MGLSPHVSSAPSRPSQQQPAEQAFDLSKTLACLHTALQAANWHTSIAQVVAEIGQRLQCLRVSIGWVINGQLRVVALSDGVVLEEGAAIPELNQAMLEAVHQRVVLTWPETGPQGAHITLAHQSLYRAQGLVGVISVPLAVRGEVVGVLICERSAPAAAMEMARGQEQVRGAFEAGERQWLLGLLEHLGPLLALQYRLDRPLSERIRSDVRLFRQRLMDPAQSALRWTMVALALVLLYAAMWPMAHRVSGNARLEGAVQRVLSASQDGFLREVMVRPGDLVKAGQVLAKLSDDELQSNRRARQAEVAQHENAFAEAFARGDRAQAAVAQSKVSEAKAQLALIEQQIERATLVAPFDGVVIQGDLRQQLGAPVKRGDPLLTLAPGLDWRVVVEVDESDVAQVQRGQTAELRLAAMPGQAIALVVERVTPVARSTAEGVRYEIEAKPTGLGAGLTGLRPGLQGVAKINLSDRPLLWRWGVHAWHWVRMAVWTWF
jgi:biotin carboxyl carrier protein